MPGRNFLFVPGPTNVPDRVLRAMHVAMEDHRSSSFPSLTRPLFADLKRILRTDAGECVVFPASGTGAWEAALCNTLSPGDKVLAARYGHFCHLWIEMAERLGLEVQLLEAPWGEGAPLERIADALAADRGHEIRAVLIVHNETSTGVTSDIAGVRRALDVSQHPAMLFVDGVSSIGALDFRMDEWKVDCAVVGTQKALMMPPGLGIVGVSQRAIASCERAKLRRVFFDLRDQLAQNANGYFPYTPSLVLLHGLREAAAMLLEEGLENVFTRHHRLAGGVRAAVAAWGLELCARRAGWYSDTVSTIMVPPAVRAETVIDIAHRRYNISFGTGLSQLAGRAFRIGHLGDLNEPMLLGALAGAEMAMRDAGVGVTPGSGVAAAEEYWRRTALPLDPATGIPRPQAQPIGAGPKG